MYFELQGNQISGGLPADLNGMSKLTLLDLAHNSMTGTWVGLLLCVAKGVSPGQRVLLSVGIRAIHLR